MKQSYRIIPIYTGDVSGIASALYELGGMVVIHDPSGCNSTYNTHDETRWYDEDSLIYISGLSEVDAILGNDDKFIRDIEKAAAELSPAFIALVSAPIPYLNGTDFTGIARVIEKRTGIFTFFVPSNGAGDYSIGAGEAFYQLAKGLFEGKLKAPALNKEESGDNPNKTIRVKDRGSRPGSGKIKINILGLTPLDFDDDATRKSLDDKLSEFEILSSWAMGSSLWELKNAVCADVNLVVSAVGLKVARYMKERFSIPFVMGVPVGDFCGRLLDELKNAAKGEKISYVEPAAENDGIYLIGEPVMMASLREHIYLRYKKRAVVINPLEADCSLADLKTEGEEDLEEILKDARMVAADPLYKPILPSGCAFYPCSHEAFSGRIFRKERVNLLAEDL